MPNIRGKKVRAIYRNDENAAFKVSLTESVAAAGGFEIIAAGATSTLAKWRGGISTMRHIQIKSPDNRWHDRIPMNSPLNPKYNNGGKIEDIAGRDGWIIVGKSGERQTFT